MRWKLGRLLAVLVVLGFALLSGAVPAHAASNSDLIDDQIFDDSGSMTAGQIDSWLNANFPNSCISTNSGFSASDPTGYTPTSSNPDGTYSYGGAVSAGTVIAHAAVAHQISPQVLLTKLENEETLVSGSAGCPDWRLASAVGYACTDSDTASHTYTYPSGGLATPLYYRNGTPVNSITDSCVNHGYFAGFSEQVVHAAWLLSWSRHHSEGQTSWAAITGNWNHCDDNATCAANLNVPSSWACYSHLMTQGNYKRCPTDSQTVYYDGYATIDGQSIHMDTGATAALYVYTPHFQSFDTIWSQWFGSPTGTILLQAPQSPAVYLISGTTRYGIPSALVMQAYGFDKISVTPVSNAYMNSLTDGGTLGTTFTLTGSSAVYMADNGYRFGFASVQQCTDWGKPNCISDAKALDPPVFNRLLNWGAIRPLMLHGSTVYLMQGGQRKAFLSGTAMTEHGYSSSDITPITNSLNSDIPVGYSFPQNNSLVKFTARTSIYLYKDGNFYQMATYNAFRGWWPANTPVFDDAASLYNSQPPTVTAMLTQFVSDSNSKKYVLAEGKKYDVTAVSTDWPAQMDASALQSNLNALPTAGTLTSASAEQLPSGFMFRVQSQKIRPFNSLYDFFASGLSAANVVTLPSSALSSLTPGTVIFGDGSGSLFKANGANTIHIVNLGGVSCTLGTLSQLSQFRFSGSATMLDSTSAAQFTSGPVLSSLILDKNGNFIVVNGGMRTAFPTTSLHTDWGITKSDLCGFSGYYLSTLTNSNQSVGHFGRAPNGVIYYGQGGQKHVLSWAKFQSLGGTSSNTIDLPFDVINMAPTGAAMN